ncbi:MAG: 50S ribosomal protein L11 [Bacteroides sp.]|nr:MAG: 50S ribosomal protein L11 [Bacteroides sp.]
MKIIGYIKLQIKGGKANPSPPIGPSLGAKGLNIMQFCKQFNDKTSELLNKTLPVIITVYEDKSFTFVIKKPPVSVQLKEYLKIEKGSSEPNRKKIGSVHIDDIKKIAQNKENDLNSFKLDSSVKMVIGTARSMGITIKY